ncbi:MAG TPA: SPOR domain-containing protein [Terriglobales bacterium]|nr:SPOR domain-containing protein [Terriglobales bacterium]
MGEQDTEITLGTVRLLGLFFGLVIVCGAFFGLGFSMGRSSAKSTLMLTDNPASTLPSSGAPKASANAATKIAESSPAADNATPAAVTKSPQAADPSTVLAAAPEPKGESDSNQATAPPPVAAASGYLVQVAAVTKQEDAEALVGALRNKHYTVFVSPGAGADKLFHVQIGPFSDIKDAEAIRARLVSDGYNPILKK